MSRPARPSLVLPIAVVTDVMGNDPQDFCPTGATIPSETDLEDALHLHLDLFFPS